MVTFGVAEVGVYVARKAQGQGIGSALLAALIAESEKVGIWTLQAGVFPEHSASLTLHKRHGFREVGTRKKLGKMTFGELAGTWRDVILLERRSNLVGID
jgi:L-amino acid N-acyltransferase YncA